MIPLRLRSIRMSDADWQSLTLACKLHGLKRSRLIRDGARTEIMRLVREEKPKTIINPPLKIYHQNVL